MPQWIRFIVMALLTVIMLPLQARVLNAQEPGAPEWIYCPTAPEERERRCREADETLHRNRDLIARVGAQMQDPETMLVRVERAPDESLSLYKARARRQEGVATPATNRWIPIQGRYFDPDRQVMVVALDRSAYWRYIWETLAPDEALARRTFSDRERESMRYKQRFLTSNGKLDQWQAEIEEARRFRQACCQPLFDAETEEAPAFPERPPFPGR